MERLLCFFANSAKVIAILLVLALVMWIKDAFPEGGGKKSETESETGAS